MNNYKTVKKGAFAEFVEKKSRFIGYVKPVKTEDEAIEFVNAVRKKHSDATHNCYAYIVRENNIMRYSDDGEPAGTAGMPILDVLRKEDLRRFHDRLQHLPLICRYLHRIQQSEVNQRL